jgi:hypothetical protein
MNWTESSMAASEGLREMSGGRGRAKELKLRRRGSGRCECVRQMNEHTNDSGGILETEETGWWLQGVAMMMG